ncbi:BTAD domain-containing putative transcriptional regulator [Streptomyces catenulae]|uniref:BTAD domain-containing putative transcriptional regulator n=1 Tax=Streptomyces catenulae TaxID=66875 RepID=A0ABV2Z1W8_9ACTN|nr:BTAD domain-containing putative transcriptional regulator [Streptomyces catenulae]
MEFRVLGPLEADRFGEPIALGGTKQRATLGFLLLHANRVVATSQLVSALWPANEEPASARKIIQNAVWGLRGALSEEDGSPGAPQQQPGAALLTQAPGYRLRVEPDQVDMHLFHRRVEEGRGALAAGQAESAARLLHQALDLWRGPALADLVEAGADWPDLVAVEKTRLNAMEDWLEAELACGRHHSALADLEAMVEAEPLRERSCGQLMVALYRCGRQADALAVYDRTRSGLVGDLGLEPGRELQSLQHAILNHDLVLEPPARPSTALFTPAAAPRPGTAGEPGHTAAGAAEVRTDGQEGGEPSDEPTAQSVSDRLPVSIVLFRTPLATQDSDVEAVERDTDLHTLTTAIREEVEQFEGSMVATIGSVSLALFRSHNEGRSKAERAVRAALAVRDRCAGDKAGRGAAPDSAMSAAVATGEALVRYQPGAPDSPVSVVGVLLDIGESLLHSPGDEVWACERTYCETQFAIDYERAEGGGGRWRASGPREDSPGRHTTPLMGRDCELDLLDVSLRRACHRSVPHLVTVLGEAGIGKTRLLEEFEWQLADAPAPPRLLHDRVRPSATSRDGALAPLRRLLLSACGVAAKTPPATAAAQAHRAIERVVGDREEAARLTGALAPLISGKGPAPEGVAAEPMLGVWRDFLLATARWEPLVVVVDDLHSASDTVVDGIAQLASSAASVPLLVVAAARPHLLLRRPRWGLGLRHFSTLTLDVLAQPAADLMAESLEAEQLGTSASGPALHHAWTHPPALAPTGPNSPVHALLTSRTP